MQIWCKCPRCCCVAASYKIMSQPWGRFLLAFSEYINVKVHVFYEDHQIWQNLHRRFDIMYWWRLRQLMWPSQNMYINFSYYIVLKWNRGRVEHLGKYKTWFSISFSTLYVCLAMLWERPLMTSLVFWPFLTYLPTYLVLLYNVPFWGLFWTPYLP